VVAVNQKCNLEHAALDGGRAEARFALVVHERIDVLHRHVAPRLRTIRDKLVDITHIINRRPPTTGKSRSGASDRMLREQKIYAQTRFLGVSSRKRLSRR